MDSKQVTDYLLRIYNSNQSTKFINELQDELIAKKIYHPAIEYQLAVLQCQNGNDIVGTIMFKKILLNEIENNFSTYDTIFSDSIAMSAFSLIYNYYKDFLSDFDYFELFKLSYYYYCSHIKIAGNKMYDSLSDRGILCDENSRLIQTISNNATNSLSVNPIPQIMSDYYYASLALKENGIIDQSQQCYYRAQELFEFLQDMTINGKQGYNYTINEMAKIGKDRTENISNKISINDIDKEALKSIIMQ